VYRERPLTRVVFDRRLRMPLAARVLSTLPAGPVIIVTSTASGASAHADALRSAGATVIAVEQEGLVGALAMLPALDVQSVVIEGGARVLQSAWDEGVVDYVHLYVTPVWIGGEGVPFLPDRAFSPESLIERRIDQLGPDVLIEGYVHRPH